MPQSCRIGGGIEDMNICSRTLPGMANAPAIPDDIAAA